MLGFLRRASMQAGAAEPSYDPDFPITLLGSKLIAWWSPRDRASVWQDTSGTVAVTADGQLIERIDDKSGNGHHMTRNGGAATVYADAGYGTAAKCAQFWNGGGTLIWQCASLDHATTNRNYWFSIEDQGMHLDAYWYKEQNGSNPDFYYQPSQTYGTPQVYCSTAADGGGAKSFGNFRHMGFRQVHRVRHGTPSGFPITDGLTISSAEFTQTQANTWATPTTFAMGGRFWEGCHWNTFDIIVTDDTVTTEEATQLEEWLRARINEPETFTDALTLGFMGDSLFHGYGTTDRKGVPRAMFDLIGSEPRWGQIVVGGLAAFQCGNVNPIWRLADRNVLTIWLGTNDIYNFSRTAAQAQTAIESIVTNALSNGCDEVFVLTMIKRLTGTGSLETARQDFNASLASRAATVGYTVIDVGARSEFSDTSNTTYYLPDLVHITNAGRAVVAGMIKTALGL